MTVEYHVLNGPNLNMLGTREPAVYGGATLADIEAGCRAVCERAGARLVFAQTNHEGALVELIQTAGQRGSGIVINPAAYTHTSVAVRDALAACAVPIIEVHLSNIHRREPFRQHSYVSAVATGVISGLGAQGYLAALDALIAGQGGGPASASRV